MMGQIRYIAVAVLLISFATFVAFFGRLPALRHTPIGSLNRLVLIRIPNGFLSLDERFNRGRLTRWIKSTANTLWNDRHPVVMIHVAVSCSNYALQIFFIAILGIAELMFLPKAWDLMSTTRRVTGLTLVVFPWLFLYLSAATDPGYVTEDNHLYQMTLYPYDFTNYYPGQPCRTCHLLKPARSKHCSLCKHCISKMDHHCIFINNCVGYRNQHWFLLLLLSTGILTCYATYLGSSLLNDAIRIEVPSWVIWGRGLTWSQYMNVLAWALQEMTCVGAVSLLCLLTSPLVWGLLGYHIYLIWAGTTTNESLKWSDWQAEMADGFVFKRALPTDRQKDLRLESQWTRWPVESMQIVHRTDDGQPPNSVQMGIGDWERVWALAHVENLYDVGFLDNLRDVFWPGYGLRRPEETTTSFQQPASPPLESLSNS